MKSDSKEGDTLIVKVVASVLEKLILGNQCSGKVGTYAFLNFQSSYPPEVSIRSYLERIRKYSRCSDACFVLTLVYVDRLIESKQLVLTSLNVHRLLITCVMMAAKYHDDLFYNNAYYSKLGGLPLQELNSLEVELLKLLNFSLFVDLSSFHKYSEELRNYVVSLDQQQLQQQLQVQQQQKNQLMRSGMPSPFGSQSPLMHSFHHNTGTPLSGSTSNIPSPCNPHAKASASISDFYMLASQLPQHRSSPPYLQHSASGTFTPPPAGIASGSLSHCNSASALVPGTLSHCNSSNGLIAGLSRSQDQVALTTPVLQRPRSKERVPLGSDPYIGSGGQGFGTESMQVSGAPHEFMLQQTMQQRSVSGYGSGVNTALMQSMYFQCSAGGVGHSPPEKLFDPVGLHVSYPSRPLSGSGLSLNVPSSSTTCSGYSLSTGETTPVRGGSGVFSDTSTSAAFLQSLSQDEVMTDDSGSYAAHYTPTTIASVSPMNPVHSTSHGHLTVGLVGQQAAGGLYKNVPPLTTVGKPLSRQNSGERSNPHTPREGMPPQYWQQSSADPYGRSAAAQGANPYALSNFQQRPLPAQPRPPALVHKSFSAGMDKQLFDRAILSAQKQQQPVSQFQFNGAAMHNQQRNGQMSLSQAPHNLNDLARMAVEQQHQQMFHSQMPSVPGSSEKPLIRPLSIHEADAQSYLMQSRMATQQLFTPRSDTELLQSYSQGELQMRGKPHHPSLAMAAPQMWKEAVVDQHLYPPVPEAVFH